MSTQFLVLLIGGVSFFSSCNPISKYEQSVLNFRQLKDEQFKNGSSSPLSKKEIQSFKGLPYFVPDENYQIQAKYKSATLPQYINLYEGDEVNQIHKLTGTVEFTFNGKKHQLNTYHSMGQAKHQLFVPFKDLSNKKNTYPGGRYLEGRLLNDTVCALDFNFAYNPFCVYNTKYTCALIPSENFVNDSIFAGEKYTEPVDYLH